MTNAEEPDDQPDEQPDEQPNNPLHGITLKAILEDLVERRGWDDLGRLINIRCFNENPSVASSLKFLRKTDWARSQVEGLYIKDQRHIESRRKRNRRRASMREFRAANENNNAENNDNENNNTED